MLPRFGAAQARAQFVDLGAAAEDIGGFGDVGARGRKIAVRDFGVGAFGQMRADVLQSLPGLIIVRIDLARGGIQFARAVVLRAGVGGLR